MKISLLISALILLAAGLIGLPGLLRLQKAKAEVRQLEATDRGQGIASATSSNRRPARITHAASSEKITRRADLILAHLAHDGAPEEKARLLADLLDLTPSEWTRLVQKIARDQSATAEAKINFLNAAFMTLFRDYPAAGLALATAMSESLPVDEKRHHSMLQVSVLCLAPKDPQAAALWVRNHPLKAAKITGLKENIIRTAAAQNPGLAFEIVESLALSGSPSAYFSLGRGVEAGSAHDFMQSLRTSGLSARHKDHVLAGISGSALIKDFDKATSWFQSAGLTTNEQLTATEHLAYENIQSETPKWLDWLATQEDLQSIEIINRRKTLLRGWARQDYAAAGNWLNEQPDGPLKDAAIETYAQALRSEEPLAAADWAITLPPGKTRTFLVKNILSSLQTKDPEAAAAFRQKHNLSAK